MTEYELNHLPATDFGKRAIKRVSPVYDASFFYKKFLDALGADFDTVRGFFETLREQRFIQTVQEWGIEYLEHKYSVPVIRTDDLETRRARLGIKAWAHTPLNPAILEKYAYDNFNLRVYLDESTAGYIGVTVNALGESLFKYIKWLLIERPAHLRLRLCLYLFHYVDSDTEFILPDKVLRAPPLPKNFADKKNFPRLYAGNFLVRKGHSSLPTDEPLVPDMRVKLWAGAVLAKTGRRLFQPETQPINLRAGIHAGTILFKTGTRTFPAADSSLKYLRADAHAGAILAKSGEHIFQPETRSLNTNAKVQAGTALFKTGTILI